MAKGFTNAKTGSKFFAAIGVTYPEGSTCTCTDGVKSFAAKDTSGKWVFPIPYAASWTVTATDGTDTATQTVEITTHGQLASIALVYELIVFSTNYNTDAWESTKSGNTSSAITYNGLLELSANENYGSSSAQFTTKSAYDLSLYRNLEVTVTGYQNSGSGNTMRISVGTSKYGTNLGVKSVTGTGICILPIDAVNSMGYITLCVQTGVTYNQITNMKISKVRLTS